LVVIGFIGLFVTVRDYTSYFIATYRLVVSVTVFKSSGMGFQQPDFPFL
jgi:hypothetical protein